MNALLAPAVDALAPPDAERAVRRTRNAACFLLVLACLLPPSTDLATYTTTSRNVLALAFGLVAIVAHVVKSRRHGPWIAAAACLLPAVWIFVAGRGATWGFVLAAILIGFIAASAWRARARHVPAWRAEDYLAGGKSRLVQGLATSLVGVLAFREFAILPVHVPTGSMYPTIHGQDGHTKWQDHLLVDRRPYLFRAPRRWEIAVFEFPLQRSTNFVKRVIGLPGDRVSIREGDIWIDGLLVRKPPLVQESLWRELFPLPAATARPQDVANAFAQESVRDGGGWAREPDGVRGTAKPKSSAVSWFAYTKPLNGGDSRYDTGDYRIGAVVRADPGATAHLRIVTRGTPVLLSASATGGELRVGDDPPIPIAAAVRSGARVELSVAEGLVRACVDGVEVARGEAPAAGTKRHGCALGVSGGKVSFTAIRVERDLVYFPEPGVPEWVVEPGTYFMLGDNSESSEDSRRWKVTEFVVKGRTTPLQAAASLLNESGAPMDNIRQVGGTYVFSDVDGIPRSIPRADVVRRTDGVRAPFVPRELLVGRALMIMWPFPPAGNEFRPRFLP